MIVKGVFSDKRGGTRKMVNTFSNSLHNHLLRKFKMVNMFRTTTLTELRANLSSMLVDLEEGPLLVLSQDKPAAILIDPEMFESLNQKVELLEDLLNGRQAIADYIDDPDIAYEAEEILKRIYE